MDIHESASAIPRRGIPPSLNRLHCGILGRGPDFKVVKINERLLDWLGYREEEVLGLDTTSLVPAELRDLVQDERRAIEAGDRRVRPRD